MNISDAAPNYQSACNRLKVDQHHAQRVMTARPKEIQDGKRNACKLLTDHLRSLHIAQTGKRKGPAGQDLQEFYAVSGQDNGAILGDFWGKLVRGGEVLSDAELSRVAHLAVLNGQLNPVNYSMLQILPGGARLLRMVGSLLVETHAGTTLSENSLAGRIQLWEDARKAAYLRRTNERELLNRTLKSARTKMKAALDSIDKLVEALQVEPKEALEVPGAAKTRPKWSTGEANQGPGMPAVLRNEASQLDMSALGPGPDCHQQKTEYFAVLYRPGDPVPGTYDEEPFVGPDVQFVERLLQLRRSVAAGVQTVMGASVEERDLQGFADLPCFEPEGANAASSRSALSEPLRSAYPDDWGDDSPADIEVAEVILATESFADEPVPLVWTRSPQDSPGPESTGHRKV